MTNKAKKKKSVLGRKKKDFMRVKNMRKRERKKKEEKSKFLSSIYGVLSIGICRAKSENSFIRRGLCVGTKKEGFHRRSKGEDFGKSNFSRLGYVLETFFGYSMV